MSAFQYRDLKSFILTLLLLIACLSCSKSQGGSPSTQPTIMIWDFSDGNEANRVNITWQPGEEFRKIDGPNRIRLSIRKGITLELNVWFAQVWRDVRFPNDVKTVVLCLEAASAEQVYTDASNLIKELKIDQRDQLDKFKATIIDGTNLNVIARDFRQAADDAVQPRVVVIEKSFSGRGKEWAVTVAVGFPKLPIAK